MKYFVQVTVFVNVTVAANHAEQARALAEDKVITALDYGDTSGDWEVLDSTSSVTGMEETNE